MILSTHLMSRLSEVSSPITQADGIQISHELLYRFYLLILSEMFLCKALFGALDSALAC